MKYLKTPRLINSILITLRHTAIKLHQVFSIIQ